MYNALFVSGKTQYINKHNIIIVHLDQLIKETMAIIWDID